MDVSIASRCAGILLGGTEASPADSAPIIDTSKDVLRQSCGTTGYTCQYTGTLRASIAAASLLSSGATEIVKRRAPEKNPDVVMATTFGPCHL